VKWNAAEELSEKLTTEGYRINIIQHLREGFSQLKESRYKLFNANIFRVYLVWDCFPTI